MWSILGLFNVSSHLEPEPEERLASGRDAIGLQPSNVVLPKATTCLSQAVPLKFQPTPLFASDAAFVLPSLAQGTRVVVANLGKEEFNGQPAPQYICYLAS